MRKCLLCERDMNKSKTTFGSGCVNNIFNFLNITKPKRVKDREQLLYKNVMKQTNTKLINKNQQIWLTDRYLTLKYLNELHYGNFNKIKNDIDEDIKKINRIKRFNELKSAREIKLKEAYDLYKKERRFKENLNKLNNEKIEESKQLTALVSSFNFVFNMYKNKSQYEKNSFKEMQYAFWQTVIEVGGKYVNFKISAELLQHSLEKTPDDLHFTDGYIIEEIKRDEQFRKLIKSLIEENNDKKSFSYNKGNNEIIRDFKFKEKDLYFSLHGLTYFSIQAVKKDNKWKMDIQMEDEYNFDDPKGLDKFYTDAGSVTKSIFSSTLYNFANISERNKVIKTYHIYINFKLDDSEVK